MNGKARSASIPNWTKIARELDEFNKLQNLVTQLARSRDPDAALEKKRKYLEKRAYGEAGGVSLFGVNTELRKWMRRTWRDVNLVRFPGKRATDKVREALLNLLTPLDQASDTRARVRAVQEALEEAQKTVQGYLDQIGPERFKWHGIPVVNQSKIPETKIKMLMSGLDYVYAMFKKRGVLILLRQALKGVVLRWYRSGERGAGYYHPKDRVITITDNAPAVEFVYELFLHEVAHLIHLDLLHPDAKAEWDSGWGVVERAKEELEEKLQITEEKRVQFWDLLLRYKGNLKAIRKQLRGIERANFHFWLRNPLNNKPLVTPKKFLWTTWGKQYLLPMLEDYDNWARGYGYEPDDPAGQEYLFSRERLRTRSLGVDMPNLGIYPRPTDAQIEQFKKLDPAVEEAIDALQIPTDYGRTNQNEDFAETFVVYMETPEKLSKIARYRMERALSLSGLYGKPVMRLAYALIDGVLVQYPADD